MRNVEQDLTGTATSARVGGAMDRSLPSRACERTLAADSEW